MRRHVSMQYKESLVPNSFAFRTSFYLQFRNHAVFLKNEITLYVFTEFDKLKCTKLCM